MSGFHFGLLAMFSQRLPLLRRPSFPFLSSVAGVLVALAVAPVGRAMDADHSTWLQFFITGPLLEGRGEANRWRYAFDSPQRFGNDSRQYSQGAWRSAAGYRFDSGWSAWAGYVYTFTDTPYARTPCRESRPYQQLLWAGRRAGFGLQYRLRCEERMPDTGDDLGLRIRHRFRVSRPVSGVKNLAWVLSDEVFLNLNATDWGAHRGLDQNRVFAGGEWRWSDTARSEAGYLHQFTNRPGRPNRVNHALLLTLALSFR